MILINNAVSISEIGGKAYQLLSLKMPNTPSLWVVPASFFVRLKADPTLAEELKTELDGLLCEDKLYAVRSSAIDEDSAEASFAGVHSSFLDVKKDDVFEHIMKVFDSAFSDRATEYRRINNLSSENISVAVIVQEMVKAEISGVAFSINPVTNNPDETVISVTEGLGEKLVDGSVSGTTYTVNGDNVKINGRDVLTKGQLNAILQTVKEVQSRLHAFSDVEFALVGDKVYFLQARTIVAYNGIDPRDRSLLIDNANIIESYYGVTSPLTFTFAKDVYRDVYTATIKTGKVRTKILNELAPSLSNMLYRHEGKVYYNMNSWYHVSSILPSKKTSSQMEGMMGVRSSAAGTKRLRLNLFDMVKIGLIFAGKLILLESLSNRFEGRFEEIVSPYYGRKLSGSNEELYTLFKTIEKDIVPEFVIPVINDCAVMIFFGMLKERAKKLGLSSEELNGYISNHGDVKSVGSATELIRIIEVIRTDEELLSDFMTLSPNELKQKYQDESILSSMIREYVLEFGARVGDELKLETVTMIEDENMVFETIKQNLDISFSAPTAGSGDLPKKLRWLGERTKKYIKNRERLRIKRTKIYSVVRNIFLAFGQNYFDADRIDDPRDVFYLTKAEVFSGEGDFRALIAARKAEDAENRLKPTYNRFVFYGNKTLAVKSSDRADGLCGIPTGAGVVTAPVRLMNSPEDTLLPGEIILTRRTDPGWISLFPRAAGLIVEHGSMLSHSFVVAREMGLPAVVGIEGIASKIPSGTVVTLDGVKGVVTVNET